MSVLVMANTRVSAGINMGVCAVQCVSVCVYVDATRRSDMIGISVETVSVVITSCEEDLSIEG